MAAAPVNGIVEIAGPQQFRFDEFIKLGVFVRAMIHGSLSPILKRAISAPRWTKSRWCRMLMPGWARFTSRTGSSTQRRSPFSSNAEWKSRRAILAKSDDSRVSHPTHSSKLIRRPIGFVAGHRLVPDTTSPPLDEGLTTALLEGASLTVSRLAHGIMQS